jgi:hypothetical protein
MLNAFPTTGHAHGPGIPLLFTATTRSACTHINILF